MDDAEVEVLKVSVFGIDITKKLTDEQIESIGQEILDDEAIVA